MEDEIRAKWLHFNREIYKILGDSQIRALAQSGENLLAIHREQNRLLVETALRHKRELDLLAGEKVEPVAHEASATLFMTAGLDKG